MFEGVGYLFFDQSFGAVAAISVCAGGVMGLPLVVSDYRNKKNLKRFKVTPICPTMVLAVQVLVYTIYSLVSLITLYIVAVVFFGYRMGGELHWFLTLFALVMLSMFNIGLLVGGLARDVKMAGLMSSLLYFPMLVFSGATLPCEIMPMQLQTVADFMPLTQGIKLLIATSLGDPILNIWLPITVMIALATICTSIAIRFFKWE